MAPSMIAAVVLAVLFTIACLIALCCAAALLETRRRAASLDADKQQLLLEASHRSQSFDEERRNFVHRLEQQAGSLSQLSEQLVLSRAEARQEGERSRAASAVSYGEHLGKLQQQMGDILRLTQAQVEAGRKTTDARLEALSGQVGTQLQSHTKVILSVQEQLGALGEAAKGMQALGQDIASLQDILQAPKLRGNLGELLLAEILRQVLPTDAFALQYRMGGEGAGAEVMVDAVIHLGDRLVPIDSKFPLESFRRLLHGDKLQNDERKARKEFLEVVKGHIDAVASKYIRPDQGTYDFALAYFPAENIYYEAVVRQSSDSQSIIGYAAQKNVMPVSPSTLYAYLLTIAYGLKGLRIEHQAEAIRKELAAFQKKFARFFETLQKSGRQLELAHRHHEDALKRASKLDEQVGKITGAVFDLDETQEVHKSLHSSERPAEALSSPSSSMTSPSPR